jgi:CARDB
MNIRQLSALSALLSLLVVQTAQASFSDTFNAGTPDIAVKSLEQSNSTNFTVTLCNIGDTNLENAKMRLYLSSKSGNVDERILSSTSLAVGNCLSVPMATTTSYGAAMNRTSPVTIVVNIEGGIRESNTSNNILTLNARTAKYTAPLNTSTRTAIKKPKKVSPVNDLWGTSGSQTVWYEGNTTNSNSNWNGYSYNYSNGANNGDFSPSNPTWAQRAAAQNVIYVNTGYGYGNWYNGVVTSNGNYIYSPYYNGYNGSYNGSTNSYNTFGATSNASTNSYNTFNGSIRPNTNSYNTFGATSNGSTNSFNTFWATGNTSTNTYNTFTSTVSPSTNTYNTFDPYGNGVRPNPPSLQCSRWEFNNVTGRYEWRCDGGVWGGYGSPDLYMSTVRQNGSRNELIATVCNQGDAMQASKKVLVEVNNGAQSIGQGVYMQLNRSGCTDVSLDIAGFAMPFKPITVLYYAQIDGYNEVSESREDNNTSHWRLNIN